MSTKGEQEAMDFPLRSQPSLQQNLARVLEVELVCVTALLAVALKRSGRFEVSRHALQADMRVQKRYQSFGSMYWPVKILFQSKSLRDTLRYGTEIANYYSYYYAIQCSSAKQ
jgi:hypothetical protein